MKRVLLIGSLALLLVLPLWAQEKTKTEPKKTAEPKTTEPKTESKTEPKKSEPKKSDKEPPKEKEKASVGPQMQIEVYNLYNPAGVAIQPTTGDVFISDSGNLRILRYSLKPTRKIFDEIVSFSKDVYGKGDYAKQTKFDIGPLGLLFLNRNLLVVGDGGHEDGKELIYFVDVAQGNRQEAENAKYKLGPIGPTPGKTEKGEGNFYALAYYEPSAIFFTTNGDDTKGWVAKVNLKDNTPDKTLELSFETKKFTKDVDAPVAITVSPDKKLVIGQFGKVTGKGKDSLLLIYDPAKSPPEPIAKMETGLYDIAGLAYHPKSHKLYAVDFAWEAPKEGGLFRLDVTGEGENAKVKAERITYTYKPSDRDAQMPFAGDPSALDRPTALAFDPDGNLYITCIGTPKEGPAPKEGEKKKTPGRLVKITGLPNE